MLCCVVLCCAVLYCTVLHCYVMLCYVMLCCAVLCCAVLCCTVLCCTVLYYIILYYIILYYIILYYIILYYIILYYIILYYIVDWNFYNSNCSKTGDRGDVMGVDVGTPAHPSVARWPHISLQAATLLLGDSKRFPTASRSYQISSKILHRFCSSELLDENR